LHNIESELKKVKDSYQRTQNSLNEESEARQQDIRKIEDLKRKIAEGNSKIKDHKRTIKKLS